MNKILSLNLYLSAERALTGEITPNVRTINIDYGNDWIRIYFYYDLEPSEWEKETAEVVAGNIHSDFDYKIPIIEVGAEKIHFPYPKKFLGMVCWCFNVMNLHSI